MANKTTVRDLGKTKPVKKKRRILKAKRGAKSTLAKITTKFGKEYNPIKLPDNKAGRFLTKRRSFIPKYFRDAWGEIIQVTWPGRHETIRLTFAVFVFSVIFGLVVAFLDFGLDKLFKEIILKV